MRRKKRLAFILTALLMCFLGTMYFAENYTIIAQAASKLTKISVSTMSIPIGTLDSDSCWWNDDGELAEAKTLSVKNKVKGASYTFTSKNTKIATIKKSGGYVTGVSAGTTTIVCQQEYKNKITVIGSCNITVRNPIAVSGGYDYGEVTLGSGLMNVNYEGPTDCYAIPEPYVINYEKPEATYDFKSDSSDLIFEKTILTEDEQKYYSANYGGALRYTAAKAGAYTVSVYQTNNNVASKIGSFMINVHDVEIDEKPLELSLGSTVSVWSPVNYSISNRMYYFVIDGADTKNPDNNAIKLTRDDNKSLVIQGIKVGTATVKVYEDSVETGRCVGQYTVNVVSVKE